MVRKWFARFGFTGGIVLVGALYTVLALGQYLLVWESCDSPGRLLNAACGLAIAYVQWDVARYNRSGRHSRVTSMALRAYFAWARRWRR